MKDVLNVPITLLDFLDTLEATRITLLDNEEQGKLVIEHLFKFALKQTPSALMSNHEQSATVATIMVQDCAELVALFINEQFDDMDKVMALSARLGSAAVLIELIARSHQPPLQEGDDDRN